MHNLTTVTKPWVLTWNDVLPSFPLDSLLKARNLIQHSVASRASLLALAKQSEGLALIVMCANVQGIDVPAICYALKSERSTAEIPICIVSKDKTRKDRLDALTAGASEFLEYPWSLPEIMLRLGRHLDINAPGCPAASRDVSNAYPCLSHSQELVWAAEQYLAHCQDRLPSQGELARLMGASEGRLKAAFHEILGIRVSEYLHRLGMNSAAALLRDSDLLIIDVAEISGYSGPANFATAFRGVFGVSPTVYRERARASTGVTTSVQRVLPPVRLVFEERNGLPT